MLPDDVVLGFLLLGRKRLAALETHHNLSFLELVVKSNPLIEYEAITVPVSASAFLKVAKDTSL